MRQLLQEDGFYRESRVNVSVKPLERQKHFLFTFPECEATEHIFVTKEAEKVRSSSSLKTFGLDSGT